MVAVLCSASVGRADVEIRLNAEGEQLAAEFGLTADELATQMSDQIDLLYQVTHIEDLLHVMSNTAAFSTRGLGASYDVDRGDRFVGVTAAGFHGDVGVGVVNEYVAGSLIALALTAGVNVKDRWTVFAGAGSGCFKSRRTAVFIARCTFPVTARIASRCTRETGPRLTASDASCWRRC